MNVEEEREIPLPDNSPMAQIKRRWAAMAPQERRMVAIALAAVSLLVLWMLAVQPALRTLREAPKKMDALDAQMQRMQRMAADARELRAAPPVGVAQSSQALQSATERLANRAQLSVQGDRAVLTINTGLTSEQLRSWLAEARSAARARPVEMRLTRGGEGYTGSITVALGGGA